MTEKTTSPDSLGVAPCSAWLEWGSRQRLAAYGGTWEVITPDGKLGIIFLGSNRGLGFYAIQRLGYETASRCKYRRTHKPSIRPPKKFLQHAEP